MVKIIAYSVVDFHGLWGGIGEYGWGRMEVRIQTKNILVRLEFSLPDDLS